MKALSLMQPWASLVITGHKQIETRSWSTNYRGPLLIHASKTWKPELDELCRSEPFATTLAALGLTTTDLPRGVLLGTVELTDCRSTTTFDSEEERERAFGDFTAGRFGWLLTNPKPFSNRLTCRGFPGLFDVDNALFQPVQ